MERIAYNDIPKGIFEQLRAIEVSIVNSTLDRKLIELVKLRSSQLNGCAYCIDMHYKELRHLGETELRLSSICVWEDAPYFTEKERTVFQYTETLTKLNEKPISNSTFEALRQFFDVEEISYLSLAIAQSNTWNRLMKAFKFTPGHYRINQFEIY